MDKGDLAGLLDTGFANLARARREALDRAFREVEDRFEHDRAAWMSHTIDVWARRVERGLLPLRWTLDESTGSFIGQAGADYSDDEAVQVAQHWALTFDLVADTPPVEGVAQWRGKIGGVDVMVWAVSDRAALYEPFQGGVSS